MNTIVYVGTSLDGYIAREDGDIDWIAGFADEEVGKAYEQFISRIDAILMGRNTFEKVATFPEWSYKPHVYVLSNTLKELPDHLKGKASILSSTPAEALDHLSEKGYNNIYVDGGKLIQSLLREDKISELIVSAAPILIGSGIPLFGALNKDVYFKLTRSVVFENGLVSNYYVKA